MYQGVAVISTKDKNTRVESGWWSEKYQAQEELIALISSKLPYGGFKVVQHIKTR